MRWFDGITVSVDMSLSKLGDDEGRGRLVCCNLWGCKDLDMTEKLSNNNSNAYMWNLEKWYRLIYLQSRVRDADNESRHGYGHGRVDELGD